MCQFFPFHYHCRKRVHVQANFNGHRLFFEGFFEYFTNTWIFKYLVWFQSVSLDSFWFASWLWRTHSSWLPHSLELTVFIFKTLHYFLAQQNAQGHVIHSLPSFLSVFFSLQNLVIPPRILFGVCGFSLGVGMVFRDLTLSIANDHCYQIFQWSEAENIL